MVLTLYIIHNYTEHQLSNPKTLDTNLIHNFFNKRKRAKYILHKSVFDGVILILHLFKIFYLHINNYRILYQHFKNSNRFLDDILVHFWIVYKSNIGIPGRLAPRVFILIQVFKLIENKVLKKPLWILDIFILHSLTILHHHYVFKQSQKTLFTLI